MPWIFTWLPAGGQIYRRTRIQLSNSDRRHKGVVVHEKNHKKVEPILAKFDKLQIIGTFIPTRNSVHERAPFPSEEDIKGMKQARSILLLPSIIMKRLWDGARTGMERSRVRWETSF